MSGLKEYIMLLVIIFSVVSTAHGINDAICGTRPATPPQPRIYNGRDSAPGAWPWIGRMVPRPAGWECMVVLIDDQLALALVECGMEPNMTIVFGDTERDGASPNRQEVAFRGAYVHTDYIFLEQYGVSVLQLETPVTITDYVRPVCLSRLFNEWEAYTNCWIAGWGDLNAIGEYPRFLQQAPSGFIPPNVCERQFSIHLHETVFCGIQGGYREPRSCGDDVGAPMMCLGDDDKWYLVGQFFGYNAPCGNNSSIYTRISKQMDFITGIVKRIEECNAPDFKCNDGITCVLEEELCDGKVHCPDGVDEHSCSTDIICTNTLCLNGGICQENTDGYVCECANGWTGPNCKKVNCGAETIQIAPGSTVNLTSPLYPKTYLNWSFCEYTVSVPNGYKVLVEVQAFDLEAGFDFLHVDDSVFSGLNIPTNLTSAGESVNIRFISDANWTTDGFWLRLSAINVTGLNECLWNPCQFDGICTDEPDTYSCECIDARFGRDCITPVDHCGPHDIILDSGSEVELTSFYYHIGNIFNAAYSCQYTVTAPTGHRILVEVIDVDLFRWEFLFLQNHVYSGFKDYISDGNILQIMYNKVGSAKKGIHLRLSDYFTDGDECASQPCQNGGICVDKVNGFTCKCRRGLWGRICERGLTACGRNSFTCNNGRCIKASYVCDGRLHCGDGTDEVNCNCEFPCYNGRCIPDRYVCDKNDNCGDWSDEFRPNC